MAGFCEQCNAAIGFFSTKKVKRPDGRVAVLCKSCAAKAEGSRRAAIEASPAELEVLRGLLVAAGEPPASGPIGPSTARGRMDDASWDHIRHPDEDRDVGALLAAVGAGARSVRAQPRSAFGLDPRRRRDVASDQLMVSRTLAYAAQALAVPLPEVYVQPEQPGGLLFASVQDAGRPVAALVIRQDLLQGCPASQVAFHLGRMVAALHPARIAWLALPTAIERRAALCCAARLVEPDLVVPAGLEEVVDLYRPAIEAATPAQLRDPIARAVARLRGRNPELDIAGWDRGVAATLDRVGLALCGDLRAARAVIDADPSPDPGGRPASQRVDDLEPFFAGPVYLGINNKIGIPTR